MAKKKNYKYVMTGEELEVLMAEWGERTTSIRQRLLKELKKASKKNPREGDEEFDKLSAEQAENEKRIKELEDLIKNAHVVDIPDDEELSKTDNPHKKALAEDIDQDEKDEKALYIRQIGRLILQVAAKKSPIKGFVSYADYEPEPEEKNPLLIPYKDRPYYWAYREMKRYFDKPKHVSLVGLDELSFNSNFHASIFHIDDEKKPVILRKYWKDSNSIMFRIITNYHELNVEHPEILGFLERNGVAEYELALAKRSKNPDASGKLHNYEPLFPYKLPGE